VRTSRKANKLPSGTAITVIPKDTRRDVPNAE